MTGLLCALHLANAGKNVLLMDERAHLVDIYGTQQTS